jgi:type I restriction enzyme S subunit
MLLLRFNKSVVEPKFIQLFLNSNEGQKLLLDNLGAQATKQVELGVGNLEEIKIPLPPIEIQRQIVEKLDKQMQALEGVRLLKAEAEKRIEEILAGVWGE